MEGQVDDMGDASNSAFSGVELDLFECLKSVSDLSLKGWAYLVLLSQHPGQGCQAGIIGGGIVSNMIANLGDAKELKDIHDQGSLGISTMAKLAF